MTAKEETPLRWSLTDHCCRICWGRVLVRTTFESKKIFKCSNCDHEVISEHVHDLCACGAKMRTNKDLGLRCVVNTERSPELPNAIIATQIAVPPGR